MEKDRCGVWSCARGDCFRRVVALRPGGKLCGWSRALSIARPGSIVGYVGVPHGVEIPVPTLFYRNVGAHGGPAPARAYIPELLPDVLAGRIHPGRVFDFTTDLDGIAQAYAAMDERRAIKSLVKFGTV